MRFVCEDAEIYAPFTARDRPVYQGDCAEIFLDVVGDGRQVVELQLSPSGGVFDQQILLTTEARSDENGVLVGEILNPDFWTDLSWNLPDLKTAYSLTKTGWIADFALPAAPILRRRGLQRFEPMTLRANFLRYNWAPDNTDAWGIVDAKGQKRRLNAHNWAPVKHGSPHISPQKIGRFEARRSRSSCQLMNNPVSPTSSWPRFKTYSGPFLRRIALPLGGIGTGTVSLGGRGDLRDFKVVNRPAKGLTPGNCFLALRTQTAQGQTFARLLEGPIPSEDYEGAYGCSVPNAGFPRFQKAEFHATYPLGEVALRDADCPLDVSLRVFNPFVPGDALASSWPVAVLRVRLHNPGAGPVRASVNANIQNWLGTDGTHNEPSRNINEWHDEIGVRGLLLRSDLAPDSTVFGTLALGVMGEDEEVVSHREAWAHLSWGDTRLDFWDDFIQDGRLEPRERETQSQPVASLCVETEIAPQQTREVTFLLAWHFPNRQTWTPNPQTDNPQTDNPQGGNTIGNFYTARFSDAWHALTEFAPQLAELEAQTVAFARAFYEADLPYVVKEAAGFNLSTLRSQTVFQTPDGRMFGWEGCGPREGSCYGNCTHVWNYEQTTAFLFADLARTMRDIEFLHATGERGLMTFRVSLPLDRVATHLTSVGGASGAIAADDGQMGCIVKLFREWKMSGDDGWLRGLWPHARRALEFAWIPNGWDGDRDGVMEGCQHNTMDVEYFGPNPQMQGWYTTTPTMSPPTCALTSTIFAQYARSRGRVQVELLDEGCVLTPEY